MKNNIKKTLLKAMKKFEKSYQTLVMVLMLGTTFGTSYVYAQDPKLISGTVDLFKAISSWLLLIIPAGAGAVLAYHALQKSLSEDQAVIAEKNKMMKNVLISAAVAETASGLVTVVLSFYS